MVVKWRLSENLDILELHGASMGESSGDFLGNHG
jgi:hypothetical protein